MLGTSTEDRRFGWFLKKETVIEKENLQRIQSVMHVKNSIKPVLFNKKNAKRNSYPERSYDTKTQKCQKS
jgi:hypothetical protein